MNSVKVEITLGGEASRREALIRIVYGFVAYIILDLLIAISWILAFVNFFTCLLLKIRIGAGFTASVAKQSARVFAYIFFATDERPPIVP